MKRFAVIVLVLVACAAGFAGSLLHDAFSGRDAEPVSAMMPRSEKGGIRVALLNLEEAARQSSKFKQLKIDWENAQADMKGQQKKMQDSYNTKLAEIKKASMQNENADSLLDKRVELQSLDKAMEAAKKEQQAYLSALLNQYQKDVLVDVMAAVNEYVKLEGYDIVIQDYTVNTEDANFFSGGAYAQSMMSKPVLAAPGVEGNKNAYVVDITQAIIEKLK